MDSDKKAIIGDTPSDSQALVERNRITGFIDLPEQDKAFAVEWLTNGFKHRDAAIAVGIPPDSALRRLREPLVQGFITYLQETRYQTRLITQAFVEEHYMKLLPKLFGEEEVNVVNSEGCSVSAKKFHSSELVSVLRDLGKSVGYVPTTLADGGKVSVTINMGDFTGSPAPSKPLPRSVTIDLEPLHPPETADPNDFPAHEVVDP